MKNSQKKWVLNFVLIVLLTGFALWFALKDDADKVLSIIKDVSPLTLLAILAWSMLYNVLVGCIMTLLARRASKGLFFDVGYHQWLCRFFFQWDNAKCQRWTDRAGLCI